MLFSSFARALLWNRYDSQPMQEEAKILENGVIGNKKSLTQNLDMHAYNMRLTADLTCSRMLLFACCLLLSLVFQQWYGFHNRPGVLVDFSTARNPIFAIHAAPSFFINGRHLGLLTYHKSRVPLYGAPSACITMQLVRLGSFKLLLCSGDIHPNPGPETGADNTLFGDLRSEKS